ncbi:MAG: transcription termination/antitermination protein NusA, partial [Chloroflexi bacterium]|nr:transcription termination/antitermination protein NusA [Chloroflexota bacterium]
RGLPREVVLEAIRAAMVSAYRKSVGASAAQEIEVKIDFDKGDITVFAEKEVTDNIFDDRTEVLLEDARRFDPNCELGDLVMVDSTPEDFGRYAAQTARQGIQQKIRDAERAAQFEYFSRQVGEVTNGVVQAVNPKQATIGLDLKAEGIMLRKDMIPGERFRIHDRIRAYVYEVKDSPKGLEIMLSRAHRNFLRRLLENEVPEIFHGIVEIRSIAREPGQRAKVAVSATQMGIDPVGACVGQRGVRIQAIVRELHDEKIDVIEWSPDTAVYISKAISPARVAGVYLNHGTGENKTATVVVAEDQLSLAIGREGQNARLAAKLTGWRIDIMSIPEAAHRALLQLRENPDLAEYAQGEAETMSKVEELLQKKEEGRPLNLEDNMLIGRFVDRFERRGEEERKQIEDERALEIKRIRDEIDPRAFELNLLDVSEIKEHITILLQAAGLETFGDLLLQSILDADAILAYEGIGPKSFESIMEAIPKVVFPELKIEAEPDAEPEPEIDLEPAEDIILPVELESETVEPETSVVEESPELKVIEEEEDEEEKSFAELFSLESARIKALPEDDEEHLLMTGGKKKKARKKKSYTIEYDPDQDQTFKQFKYRDEDDWDNW